VSGLPRFDVAVLGGGSAGCVLAARLSEDPDRSVCLVEAGPDYGPYEHGRWPADIADARTLAFSHSWETDREDRSQLRAKILGGCSAHNACIVLEGAPSDYEWGADWNYETIEPYFRRAERELRVRRFRDEELAPWHRAFAEAGEVDAIVHPVNAVGTTRWNTAFAYIDPARDRSNLRIFAETLVDRVLPEAGRVITDRGEIEADSIVLAAGAYGSPGILLRSGIGPGLEVDLPVGEGLIDHVGVGLGFEPTESLQEETRTFQNANPLYMAQVTLRVRSSLCANADCDVFLFPGLDPVEGGYEVSAAVFGMKPASRGRVRLLSREPDHPLAIEHGFISELDDVVVLVEGVEALRRIVQSESVRRYAAHEIRPGPGIDAEDHVRSAVRGFFHPVGTCAIGQVVDAKARVLGVENIYVADASIVPSIPRANTNLTVVAIAERLAEMI
jgi:choline dehydrogenase